MINIMAHPSREEYIPYLQKHLGKVPVIWDKENNCLETRIRCLEAHLESGAEHCLTIQDDAILTDNFITKVEDFISSINEECVYNFYYKKGQSEELLNKAIQEGQNFIKLNRLYNEIGFSIHRKYLKDIIGHCKMRYKQGHNKDWVLQDFIHRNKIPVYFSVPSYVDHREVKSILRGSASKQRTAMWFSGDWKYVPPKETKKTTTPGRKFKLENGKIVPK